MNNLDLQKRNLVLAYEQGLINAFEYLDAWRKLPDEERA